MLTNTQLVKYCESMIGSAYWWGTFNNICTKSLYNSKKKQYPSYYDQSKYKVSFADQITKKMHCTDCVGLIKGFVWCNGDKNNTPKYNASQDVNVSGLLSICTKKGKIKTLPEVPGTCVFKSGHVGVYIGGGYVIEAKGHDYGVVKTKLSSTPWTDWGYCPWISYPEKEKEVKKTEEKKTESKAPVNTTKEVTSAVKDMAKVAKALTANSYIVTRKLNVRKTGSILGKMLEYEDFPEYVKSQIKGKLNYLPVGTVLYVTENKKGWYKIGENAWVAGNYTKKA